MNASGFRYLVITLGATTAMMSAPASAYEAGSPGTQVIPGVGIGGTTAGAPPPGLYMFDQATSYQANIVGPSAPSVGGVPTPINVNTAGAGLLWAPGWSFLGATYDAVLVQPTANADTGVPVSTMKVGVHNTFVVPGELSWKLGDSGFFVKTGLGIGVPDGSISGPTGLGNVGNPWWTFRPELILSYLKDGWNLTAAVYGEFNTKNYLTDYQSGTVVDAEFAATKTIGKWTIGPVSYYVGQVGNDTSSAFYNYAINVNRYNIWAAGGLVGYNFGPAQLNVWGVDEYSANASGGTAAYGIPVPTGKGGVSQGFKLFASVSYQLWAPDEPAAPKRPQFTK
jgi:hypothetical protein